MVSKPGGAPTAKGDRVRSQKPVTLERQPCAQCCEIRGGGLCVGPGEQRVHGPFWVRGEVLVAKKKATLARLSKKDHDRERMRQIQIEVGNEWRQRRLVDVIATKGRHHPLRTPYKIDKVKVNPVECLQLPRPQRIMRRIHYVRSFTDLRYRAIQLLRKHPVAPAESTPRPPLGESQSCGGMLDRAPRAVPEKLSVTSHLLPNVLPELSASLAVKVRDSVPSQPGIKLARIEDAGAISKCDTQNGAPASSGAHHIDDLRPVADRWDVVRHATETPTSAPGSPRALESAMRRVRLAFPAGPSNVRGVHRE